MGLLLGGVSLLLGEFRNLGGCLGEDHLRALSRLDRLEGPGRLLLDLSLSRLVRRLVVLHVFELQRRDGSLSLLHLRGGGGGRLLEHGLGRLHHLDDGELRGCHGDVCNLVCEVLVFDDGFRHRLDVGLEVVNLGGLILEGEDDGGVVGVVLGRLDGFGFRELGAHLLLGGAVLVVCPRDVFVVRFL